MLVMNVDATQLHAMGEIAPSNLVSQAITLRLAIVIAL
jgi:hypothetical protein